MLLIDNREPKSVQALLAENKRLQARVEQLTKVLIGILRVRDCYGVWALVGSREIKDARQVLGLSWEIFDLIEDVIQDVRENVTHRQP